MVTRFTLLKELSAIVPDDVLVLTSIGNNSGFWGQLKDREANLFHLTMGMCSSTALGLALALPNRKIVALDSDGNLTLNLGVLGTIANEAPKNLTIVLMDNQNYLGSNKHAPGMPTATAGKMNLEAVAKGCGIESACTIEDAAAFRAQDSGRAVERRPAFYPRPRRAARYRRAEEIQTGARPAGEQISICRLHSKNRRRGNSRQRSRRRMR